MQTTQASYERGIDLYKSGAVIKTETKGVFTIGFYTVDTRRAQPCDCNATRYAPNMVCKHVVASLRKMLDDLMYRVPA